MIWRCSRRRGGLRRCPLPPVARGLWAARWRRSVFPDIGLQGFAPKLAKGEIASLSGAGDDPRYFQISAPVQPGNSGGALVDELGNVIGIVSAKLDASAAAGGKRGVAGECELRGQKQSVVELPGIRAGCFGHGA